MSLLLLFKSAAPVAPPAPSTPAVVPSPVVEIDFTGNPTATYADIHQGADGVVSFWRMNSTTTFLDERLANSGTLVSTPSLVSGPYTYDSDQALAFDGSSDSAYVISSPSLTTQSQFSIAGWLNLPSLPASTKDIVSKRGSWLLRVTSAGKLVWTLKDDTSTVSVTSNTVLATNTWYHVTGIYTDTEAQLYINAVLDNSAAYSSGLGLDSLPIVFAGTPSATAPTYQSTQSGSSGGEPLFVTKPTSTAAGDLLIAHTDINDTSVVLTSNNNFIPLADINFASGTRTRLYYKIATASEPATYTWTTSGNSPTNVHISRITGANPIWPFASRCFVQQQAEGTTHVTGPHVPDTPNTLALAFFSLDNPGTWTSAFGAEAYDTGNNAMYYAQQASEAALEVTATSSSSALSNTGLLFVQGTGVDEVACSLKDWAYWSRSLTAQEIARNYSSRDSGEGTWTNVSTSVRNFDVSSTARQYELDQMEAGTMSLVLRDEDRSFDPANGSSPYAPNVVPVRRIRGRTTYQGTVYDLWHTYIERWPPQNAQLGYQEIGITAVDGFDALALAQVTGTLAVGYSGAQIDALLDKALWPKDKRDIEQGQYVMAGQTLSSAALGAIQEIAASERGIFFVDSAGIATFHDSAHRGSFPRSTSSQATFVDSHLGTGIVYQDLEPSFDKDKIVNDWTVVPDSSTFGAADQQQVDASSVARYWRRSSSRSTRLASNADALSQAGNLLNETSQPAQRFDSITVLPTTTAAYVTCLGLRISDRVTVVRGTGLQWDGDVLTKDCFIEARKISARPVAPWTFTFSLSPVSAGNYRATIIRDGPVSYWRMDTQS